MGNMDFIDYMYYMDDMIYMDYIIYMDYMIYMDHIIYMVYMMNMDYMVYMDYMIFMDYMFYKTYKSRSPRVLKSCFIIIQPTKCLFPATVCSVTNDGGLLYVFHYLCIVLMASSTLLE